jgi:hypothetical protein
MVPRSVPQEQAALDRVRSWAAPLARELNRKILPERISKI